MSKTGKPNDDFNMFVAGKTGAFKGIKIDRKAIIVKNLQNIEILKPEHEISILNWSCRKESEILIGTIDQIVKIYDIEFKAYCTSLETKFGYGPLVGLTRINGAVSTCSSSGHLKIWKFKNSDVLELLMEGNVCKMRKSEQKEGIIGIGGQNNDLKLWDLEKKTKIFNAKNVRKDNLELEMPIWVTDLTFIPNFEYKVAVSTRHGQIRLYDTKAQRRPVINISLEDQSLNTISLCCNTNQVVVGSTTGHIMVADFRGKGQILHRYKGAVGSVRQVAAHPNLPYFASVGLDRYMRVHHIESRQLLHQQYLKVRLNCILMSSSFGLEWEHNIRDKDEDNIECVDLECDNEYNEIFDKMDTINEINEPKQKKARKKFS